LSDQVPHHGADAEQDHLEPDDHLHRRRGVDAGVHELAAELGLLHRRLGHEGPGGDRKSTRLNSSHDQISYAVFCLKKKKTKQSAVLRDTHTTAHTRPTSTRFIPIISAFL